MQRGATAHGAYLLFGGLWPLLSMSSFEAVTGPKSDHWLVRTVAGVLLVVGSVLWSYRRKVEQGRPVFLIAAGVSGVLALVAIVTTVIGRIWPVYLLDGAAHLVFAVCWCLLLRGRSSGAIGERSA